MWFICLFIEFVPYRNNNNNNDDEVHQLQCEHRVSCLLQTERRKRNKFSDNIRQNTQKQIPNAINSWILDWDVISFGEMSVGWALSTEHTQGWNNIISWVQKLWIHNNNNQNVKLNHEFEWQWENENKAKELWTLYRYVSNECWLH